MKPSLLFGKRRLASASDAAQYAGTDTELDTNKTISDRALKTSIRPLVRKPETRQAADGARRS